MCYDARVKQEAGQLLIAVTICLFLAEMRLCFVTSCFHVKPVEFYV